MKRGRTPWQSGHDTRGEGERAERARPCTHASRAGMHFASTQRGARTCAVPTLSMTIGLMSPAAYLTSARAKLPSRKARPTLSLASMMFLSRARSRIERASAFFFSKEWPFFAPVSFTFITCKFCRVGKTANLAAAMLQRAPATVGALGLVTRPVRRSRAHGAWG